HGAIEELELVTVSHRRAVVGHGTRSRRGPDVAEGSPQKRQRALLESELRLSGTPDERAVARNGANRIRDGARIGAVSEHVGAAAVIGLAVVESEPADDRGAERNRPGALPREVARLYLHVAATELARTIRRVGLLNGHVIEQVGGKKVEGDHALVLLRACDAYAV